MNVAVLRWPEYAVERMLVDLKMTTLAFMRAPDNTAMPISDEELIEPVRENQLIVFVGHTSNRQGCRIISEGV